MAGKASKKFDLGELTRALAGDVPDPGTEGREQIEYIDIGLIDSDPGNFYELRDIPDLAGDIETVGLQQPLLVRPGEDGRVVLISGHRRRAALQLLVDEGKEQFRQVPCIRKTGGNALVYEMQLIFANAHTRVLTNAEIGKQAARLEEIFYQLKEQGYEFPGRMIDHVAEACNIKRAKLGRLKKIEAHLAPCYKPLWDAGNLPEDTADALDIAAIKAGQSVSIKAFEDFRDAAAEDGVDYMIFDCPPGFSAGSVAALNAADGVVVTTKVDGFSLRGVAKLRAQLRSMICAGNGGIDGVLITQWRKDAAVLAGEQVLRSARGLKVFDTVIRWSNPVDGSTMAQQPLDEYSPRSNAAQDYRAWVKEYLGEEVQA